MRSGPDGTGADPGWGLDMDADLLCVTDSEGRFVSLNAAWERVLGWTREELQARPYVEFVHPDDVVATIDVAAGVSKRDAEISEFVNRYRARDGSYRWLRWSARSDGETWFAVAHDITAQRERKEDLQRILTADRLVAYAQPIVDLHRLHVTHEELLVRLRPEPPDQEMIRPAAFVEDAERLGLIAIVDLWMLRQALDAAERGRTASVNVSSRSIDDPDVLREICAMVEARPDAARGLIFEITETAAFAHLDAALELIHRLEPLGCGFALDDFGTGFGSLTYLRHLRVDSLKIDRSFVRGVARDEADQALVRSVVAIATELGLRTVAEGVEDGTTLEILREYGVDQVQGYLIGVPEPLLYRGTLALA